MKTIKNTLAISVAITIGTTTFAQKISGEKVPAAVKSTFIKMCKGAVGTKWEMEKGNYEASYQASGKTISALFSKAGNMLESEVAIKTSDLPAPVLAYLKENRKGLAIHEADKITKANGQVNFEAEVNGKDMLFDKNGEFLKEQAD